MMLIVPTLKGGSWLACESITSVHLKHRGACIAGKPAPTGLASGSNDVDCPHTQRWELACLRKHHLGTPETPRCLHRGQARSHRGSASGSNDVDCPHTQRWELACLRKHHLGTPETPRCLHRGQARSHRVSVGLK